MKKYIKEIMLVLITAIVVSVISVSASMYLSSEDITFVPDNTNWNVSNTNSALNDLYSYANSGDATASNILVGKTALVNGTLITGTMTDNGAVSTTINPGGSYTIPAGYHNGSGKVTATEKSLDNSKVTNVIVTGLTATPKGVNTPENCVGAVVAKGWGNGAGAYYIDASTNRIYWLSVSGGGSASTPGYADVTSSHGNRLYFKNGVLYDAYFGSVISNVTDSIIFFSK